MKRHWKVQINLNGLSNTSKAWQGCMSNKKERKNTIKFQLHTDKNKLNVSHKTNINSKKNEICHMSVWLWMQVRKEKIISSMPE